MKKSSLTAVLTGQIKVKTHGFPDKPWSKVALDLLQLQIQGFLIIVGYFSDFYDVRHMHFTRSQPVIQALGSPFARKGIPGTVVSDNGSQFACAYVRRVFVKKAQASGEDVQLALFFHVLRD